MNELSFRVDRNLRIRSWSADMELLTGTIASQAIGKKYTDILPRFLLRDREAIAEALRHRRTIKLKQCHFRCLSHYQQAAIKIAPIRSGSDSVRGAEIVLEPSEPCSVGRQLTDSQKLIAIGKVAATLAHGVRNPLNAIKGAVVYLHDRYAHETTLSEFTEILSAEIARLESFISRFLSTTAFESDMGIVDVNDLLRKIKVFISLQTFTRNIQCEYELGDVPPIEISAFHLEQAILNVINNAIEAAGPGGSLMIRTAIRANAPAPSIALEIADNGKGPSPYLRTAAPGGQPRGPGRGFGLFIADEIVRYFHGQLTISGENGKGTTVTFLLPVAQPTNGDIP